MNNLTFDIGGKTVNPDGHEVTEKDLGYCETISGSAGAGPTWNGVSGVHTHMTETQITDPEVFEKRHPVLLREFSIREGSGGEGMHHGGDGIVRNIDFLVPQVQLLILLERTRAPESAGGGKGGMMGKNLWVRKDDGLVINLGGKATATFEKGDIIIIKSAGGGGCGRK